MKTVATMGKLTVGDEMDDELVVAVDGVDVVVVVVVDDDDDDEDDDADDDADDVDDDADDVEFVVVVLIVVVIVVPEHDGNVKSKPHPPLQYCDPVPVFLHQKHPN